MTTSDENSEDKEMKDDQNTSSQNQPTIQDLYASAEYLNCDIPCSAARSLKIITASSGDPNSMQEDRTTRRSSSNQKKTPISYMIFTFSDGRVLTMSLDHAEALKQDSFKPELLFITRNESSITPDNTSCLGENRILSIGTIEGILRELEPNSLLVSCDRPALFYIMSGRLEMQYLREDIVNQANLVDVKIKAQDD